MWFVFALLSAVFAALTSILAKIGIGELNSNLATVIRTVVVVVMAWGMGFPDKRTGRAVGDTAQKLDFPDTVGACDGRIVAVLLPRGAARKSVRGRARRQAERGVYCGAGGGFSARGADCQNGDRVLAYRGGNAYYGFVDLAAYRTTKLRTL